MKNLKDILIEGFQINKNTRPIGDKEYSDEELLNDYDEVWHTFSLSEKKPYQHKYGVKSNKKEDIQIAIAQKLKENRRKKTDFDDQDRRNFYNLSFKARDFYKYLDEEPIEFVKYLFNYYENLAKKKHILQYLYLIHMRDWNYKLSYADKDLLLEYEKLQKYLVNKGVIK